MKLKLLFCLFLILAFVAMFAQAQEPSPAPADLLENSWKLSLAGGYSNLSNQATNNGYLTSLGARVAKHWNARLDYFSVGEPKAAIIVAGPEYVFSLRHILPASSFLDVSKFEAFGNARIGAGRAGSETSPFKFAVAVGGGLQYLVSDKYILRPLELSYVRSAAGVQVIGNHMQFASSIGLRF